jgi:hypothetical protein
MITMGKALLWTDSVRVHLCGLETGSDLSLWGLLL